MTDAILVTGATGTVGRHVAETLSDRDADVRRAVRSGTPDATDRGGEAVAFDFTKPETWGPALDGVDGVFLMRPPTVDASAVGEFVDAAARVGVSRVAYLSVLGAGRNPLIPHHRIERRVRAAPVRWTLLRASFFMQNLLEVHRRDVLERDEVFVPAGDGETSFVDARDVGAVAAVVLTDAGHGNRAYDLTGPAALSYTAVAAIFTDVLGRPISYPYPSLVAFATRMVRRGHPLGFVLVTCGIYTTARLGLAGRVTDDVRRLLGRPPGGLRTFVEDHAAQFGAEAA